MPFDLLLIPLAIGHLVLFVLVVNLTHGLGHPEPVMTRVKLAILTAYLLVTTGLVFEAWRDSVFSWSWPALAYATLCVVVGLVLFPAATAYLHRRSAPTGVERRSEEVDLAGELGHQALRGSGLGAWLLKLPGNESTRLHKVEWDVEVPGLPEAFDGLSLLHLSDLHFTTGFHRNYFERMADAAASWPSDLVLFTGDLVDDDAALDWIEPVLSRVRGRLGAFSILGNHDIDHDPERIREALAAAGFVDLEGRWATVESGDATVALAGTMHPWGPRVPMEQQPEADYRILLSHAPDMFYWAERSGFDLMLSGHVHGGQVRLPLVGAVFMPSLYSRRFDRGFFRKGRLMLHVSQGVGAQHPIRYNCPPEIGRIVLRRVEVEDEVLEIGRRERASRL
jgi:predicted MPP superfamily phosphohydrolase